MFLETIAKGRSSVRMTPMIWYINYIWITRSKLSAQSKRTTPQTPCLQSMEPGDGARQWIHSGGPKKYPPSSTRRIPTRWILVYDVTGFGAIQSGPKGGIGRNVVVLLCAWLICFNKSVFKVRTCCQVTLNSRSKPSSQSKPTTPQTPCVRSVEPGVGSTPGESERYPPSSTRRIPARWILVCDVSDFGVI